ncbi:hypothetical protein FN846DRAFT_886512 [Sphaerosporella brunnea]|uniref:Uncharacterized protein n=1 Tax=Sphaerosporella brunnea TaxID=1250544 RepID=A0A5J5F9A2_9PEZI|nr:hypothetical protein FN846DRAFT_886512 [Sphaerosporella brunnea]
MLSHAQRAVARHIEQSVYPRTHPSAPESVGRACRACRACRLCRQLRTTTNRPPPDANTTPQNEEPDRSIETILQRLQILSDRSDKFSKALSEINRNKADQDLTNRLLFSDLRRPTLFNCSSFVLQHAVLDKLTAKDTPAFVGKESHMPQTKPFHMDIYRNCDIIGKWTGLPPNAVAIWARHLSSISMGRNASAHETSPTHVVLAIKLEDEAALREMMKVAFKLKWKIESSKWESLAQEQKDLLTADPISQMSEMNIEAGFKQAHSEKLWEVIERVPLQTRDQSEKPAKGKKFGKPAKKNKEGKFQGPMTKSNPNTAVCTVGLGASKYISSYRSFFPERTDLGTQNDCKRLMDNRVNAMNENHSSCHGHQTTTYAVPR